MPVDYDMMLTDIAEYKKFSVKAVPAEPNVLPWLWIDINDILEAYETNKNYNTPLNDERFISVHILQTISAGLRDNDCSEVALLIDRDLFMAKNADSLFVNLVRHRYFKSNIDPAQFAYCYGGVPMRRRGGETEDDVICPTWRRSCGINCADIQLKTCKHTCYWQLIGMMLGAYPLYQEGAERQWDTGIAKALPKIYTYK
jgi:hypothetical protein